MVDVPANHTQRRVFHRSTDQSTLLKIPAPCWDPSSGFHFELSEFIRTRLVQVFINAEPPEQPPPPPNTPELGLGAAKYPRMHLV